MRRARLGDEDVDRLLSGSVAPDDAPPGYGPMATLLEAVNGRRSGPAEMDPAFEKQMVDTVRSAAQPVGASRWRRCQRKAAVGVIFAVAATSSLAAADVIPGPFGGLVELRRGGTGDSPSDLPSGGRAERQDSRVVVPSTPGGASEPPAQPNTPGAPQTGAPPQPMIGTRTTPPPQPGTVPSGQVPSEQSGESPGSPPSRGLPPGASSGNGNAYGNGNGNGNAYGNGNGAPPAPQAPGGDSPGQGNAYGRDGQPGPPPGRVPPGRVK